MSFWSAVGLSGSKEQQELLAVLQENQESVNHISEQVLITLQKQAAIQVALTQGFLEIQSAIAKLEQDMNLQRKYYEKELEKQNRLLADIFSGSTVIDTSLSEIKNEISDSKSFIDTSLKDLRDSVDDNKQIVNTSLRELKDISVSNSDNLLDGLNALKNNMTVEQKAAKKYYDELKNNINTRCEKLSKSIAEFNLHMSKNDDLMLAGISELEQKNALIVKQQKKNYTEILSKLQALFDLNNNVRKELNVGLLDNQQEVLQLFDLLKCVWLNDLSKDIEMALGNIKDK